MSDLKSYDDLLQYIIPEVPGCPQPLAKQYIRVVAREFCAKTEAWLEWLPSMKLIDGRLEYHLECEYDAEIRRIKTLRINTEDGVSEGDPGEEIDALYYEFDPSDDNLLTLADSLEPAEDVSQGLELRVVLVPYLGATEISRCFMNRWDTALIAGTLFSLLSMTAVPWADPQRAVKYMVAWNDSLGEAKSDHHKFGTDRPLTITA